MTSEDSPRVSIVIPCHNYGPFLAEAIESALGQTVPADEIVIVDDGSTDSTAHVARGYADRQGVQVISQTNHGAIATYNIAIRASTGQYFVLLSADDRLDPLFIERTLPVLRDQPGAAYAYTAYRMFGARRRILDAPPFSALKLRLRPYISATCLMRRSAFDEAGGFEKAMAGGHEDWEFFVKLLALGWTGIAVREVLLEYRKHVTASRNSLAFAAWLDVRARVHDAYPQLYSLPRSAYLCMVVANLQWLRLKSAPRALLRLVGAKQHARMLVLRVHSNGVSPMLVDNEGSDILDETPRRARDLPNARRRHNGVRPVIAATRDALRIKATVYHATDAVGLIAGAVAASRNRSVLVYEPRAALARRGPGMCERLALLRCDGLIAPAGEAWRRRWPMPPILVRDGLATGERHCSAGRARLVAVYRDLLSLEHLTLPARPNSF